MCGHSLDQHGEDFARIALPVTAMDKDQTGRGFIAGRVEIDLGSFAVPVRNVQSSGAAARNVAEASLRAAIKAGLLATALLLS
jgi:hypothetical protein